MDAADFSDLPVPTKQGKSDFSDLPVPPKEKSFGEKYVQPTTDVLNRGLVAGTLGSVADIGNLPFEAIDYVSKKAGYPTKLAQEKPFLGSEYIGQKMQEAGIVTPTRRPGAEFAASLIPAAVTGGPALAKFGISKGKELIDFATGKKVKGAYEALKSTAGAEGLAGKSALEAQATGATQKEKEAVKAAKDIEEAKFATRSKVTKEAEQANKEVDASLNKVSNKPVSDEEFGAFVSEKGGANVKAISAETERKAIDEIKDPAFERSRTRYAQGDSIATNPNSSPILERAIADVRQQIADTPADFRAGLEKKLNSLFGEEVALDAGELKAAQLRSSITGEPVQTTKQIPLTLQQTEFLRRWAKDPILRERTGFGALDDMRMKATGDTLQEAMIAYEKDVGRYIDEYRKGKQAQELALGGKAGESAIETFGTKPQNIASYYLDGTKASADKLVNLVGGKSNELVSQVAGKIRNDLQGLDAAKTQKYLQDKAGLFEVFPELKTPINNLAANRVKAEKFDKMYASQQARLSEAIGATQGVEKLIGTGAKSLDKPIQKIEMALEELNVAETKDIVTAAEKVIEQLRNNNLIDGARREELLTQIKGVGKSVEKAENLRKRIRDITIGAGVLSGANYGLRKIFGLGY
jgi:hypothetical protein